MMDKKQSRLRRGRQTRAKIAELKVNRLAVHRTNLHIYANLIGPDAKILASASTMAGPSGVSLDSSGNLFVAVPFDNRIVMFPADATLSAAFRMS